MSNESTVTFGRRPDDIIEEQSGGLEVRAMGLMELAGQVEWAAEEFAYDGDVAADLLRLCGELSDCLNGLFLDADARLTTTAVCRACGGNGSYNRSPGEPVQCEECGGTGAVSRES
jgi:DnaJ-class molecular chaperone